MLYKAFMHTNRPSSSKDLKLLKTQYWRDALKKMDKRKEI